MEFKSISLDDKKVISKYLHHYDNSCQFNFANLFCLSKHYKIQAHIDGAVFIRQNLQTPRYFLPHPTTKISVKKLLDFLKQINKTPIFWHITPTQKALLESEFDDLFLFNKEEDWGEYMYDTKELLSLTNKNLSKIKRGINQFHSLYWDWSIEKITSRQIDLVRDFQKDWLENEEITPSLEAEDRAIKFALKNFRELNLSGILLYHKNSVIGYAYGCVKNSTFDLMVLKADKTFRHIYKKLVHEVVKFAFSKGCTMLNMEEDIGLVGLKQMKEGFRPKFILPKYSATLK